MVLVHGLDHECVIDMEPTSELVSCPAECHLFIVLHEESSSHK